MKKLINISLVYLFFVSYGVSQTPHLDSLQSVLDSLEGKERLNVLYTLSNALESILPIKAKEYGAEGLMLAEQLGDSVSAATLLSSLAFSSTELGNFSDALIYAHRSLAVSTAIRDKKKIASANSTLGITYVYLGQYSKALTHHLEALRLREELGLIVPAATTMNNIGVAYHNIGQYEKAITFYKKAQEKLGPLLTDVTRSRYYVNIGFSEFKRGNLDSARYYFNEALRLSSQSPYNVVKAYLYFTFGLLNSETRNYPEALNFLHRSLAGYTMLGQKYGVLQLYNALAEIYFKTGQYTTALKYLDSAVVLGKIVSAPDQVKVSYELYFRIYQKTGPLSKEYAYFQLYSAAKDSLMNYNESKKIAEAAFSYEIAQQQREIELLKREKTIADLSIEKDDLRTRILFGGVILSVIALVFLYSVNLRVKKDHLMIEQKNSELKDLNDELQSKIGEVNLLSGLLPICANCKKIRDDDGEWEPMERYISNRSEAKFSHGICPDCMLALYGKVMKKLPRAE